MQRCKSRKPEVVPGVCKRAVLRQIWRLEPKLDPDWRGSRPERGAGNREPIANSKKDFQFLIVFHSLNWSWIVMLQIKLTRYTHLNEDPTPPLNLVLLLFTVFSFLHFVAGRTLCWWTIRNGNQIFVQDILQVCEPFLFHDSKYMQPVKGTNQTLKQMYRMPGRENARNHACDWSRNRRNIFTQWHYT